MAPFKLSFFVALFVAMPYVLYQIWAFVAPGLYRHEKRFAVPLLVSTHRAVLRRRRVRVLRRVSGDVRVLRDTAPAGVLMMTDITNYLDFVLMLFFAFGIAFEVPVAMVLLVLTGMVSVETLARTAATCSSASSSSPPSSRRPMRSRNASWRCRCTCSTRAASSWRESCRRAPRSGGRSRERRSRRELTFASQPPELYRAACERSRALLALVRMRQTRRHRSAQRP